MSDRARLAIFIPTGIVLLVLLLWGMRGLPPFGHNQERLGLAILASAPTQRQALAVVTAINFDYRGIDTLGEEFILYAAVIGVALLLRSTREKEKEGIKDEGEHDALEEKIQHVKSLPKSSDAIRGLALVLIPLTLFFGLYVVLTGHISLGGGFQGGVILSTAWLLVFLAGEDALFYRVAPMNRIEFMDAIGAGAYAIIGFVTLLTGAAFLQNILPLGKAGNIASAGTIPVINCFVGIEVAAAFVLLYHEYIKLLGQQKARNES